MDDWTLNVAAFEEQRTSLLQKHQVGSVVLLRAGKVVDVFPTETAALQAGDKLFGAGASWLIEDLVPQGADVVNDTRAWPV